MRAHNSNYNYDKKVASKADGTLQRLLAQSQNCKTSVDYENTIKLYFASYEDPHIQRSIEVGNTLYSLGIIFRNFNGHYHVVELDSARHAGVNTGDELISCDGITPDEMMNRYVVPLFGSTDIDTFKERSAYRLSYRIDVNAEDKLQCTFANLKTGQKYQQVLAWSPSAQEDKLFESYRKKLLPPLYVKEKYAWGTYIRLGKMYPSDNEESARLNQFIEDAKSLQKEAKILLDLRGNDGGNSHYGSEWVKNLTNYTKPLSKVDGMPTLLWSSQENLDHFKKFFADFLKSNAATDSVKQELACLSKAKIKSFTECEAPKESDSKQQSRASKFKGKLVLLTDGGCFSSCELFVQYLKQYPFVTHIGLPTNKSTLFGDIRYTNTPNKKITFSIPQKVFMVNAKDSYRYPTKKLAYDIKKEFESVDSLKQAAISFVEKLK